MSRTMAAEGKKAGPRLREKEKLRRFGRSVYTARIVRVSAGVH
jgi:hypothetical protein